MIAWRSSENCWRAATKKTIMQNKSEKKREKNYCANLI